MDSKLLTTIFGIYLFMNIIGICYLCFGNVYSKSYDGILKEGSLYSKTSCTTNCNRDRKNCHTTCSNTYYVDEIFFKNNNTESTCTVRRPTVYYFIGDANNFISTMKLGTTRKLYQNTYSAGTCIDEKIRYLYNCIGSILLAYPNFCLLIFLLLSTFDDEFNYFKPQNITLVDD